MWFILRTLLLTTCLLIGGINKPMARSHKSSTSSFHIEGIVYQLVGFVRAFVWEMGLSVTDIITVRLLQCIRVPLSKACLVVVYWISLCLLQFSMYQKLCCCEEKNIFDNIEIQISISQQRASITSTALDLTMRLRQLSAVGGIYKINSRHLLMQKWCNDNALMPFLRYGLCIAEC